MDDLYLELQAKLKQLDASIKQLRKSGTDYADAEKNYKILLRSECLNLRAEGMAIGLIDKNHKEYSVVKLRSEVLDELYLSYASVFWELPDSAIYAYRREGKRIHHRIHRRGSRCCEA